jgi:NADH-quinone oxidoreductase subunit L
MFVGFALRHAWLIPLLPAAAFVIVGLFIRPLSRRLSAAASIGAIGASLVLSYAAAWGILAQGITVDAPLVYKLTWVTIGPISLDMGVFLDPIAAMMLVVVTTVSFFVEIYSVGYMQGDPGYGRFFSFISLFAASMLGLVIASNFLELYVFWELVGLCSYLLIGFYYYRISAREAAKKAFITTRVGDFGLLLGILLLQIHFGTLDFLALREAVPAEVLTAGTGFLGIAGLLLFIGPIGKSGQFPLHVWLPDAMEGPTPVSALIHAATMVVAGVYLVARAYFIFVQLPFVMEIIAWVGGFTAIFAALIALTQHPIKRILAYSTISQLGYMMLALGVGSLTASMFHLMTHAFFKALLFLCAGAVMQAMADEADIFKMGGLRRKMPVTFAAMTIGVLAISGLPPFAGFFSKDEILAAAAQVSLPLYVLGTVTAFLTAFYMARLLFVVFLGEPDNPDCQAHEVSAWMTVPLIVLAALSVVSGFLGHVLGFGDVVRFGLPEAGQIDPAVAVLSTLLSLLAFGLAWRIYVTKQWSSDAIAAKMGVLYTLSFHKFYVDEFYAVLIRYFVDGLGRVFYWIDLHIVDGAVNGLAWIVRHAGGFFAKSETGQVQQYAAVFFAGVILLTAYAVFYAHEIMAILGGAF